MLKKLFKDLFGRGCFSNNLKKSTLNRQKKELYECKSKMNKFALNAIILTASIAFLSGCSLNSSNKSSQAQDAVNKAFDYMTKADGEEWRVFNSSIGRFEAKFPSYPVTEKEVVQIPDSTLTINMYFFISEVDDHGAYIVGVSKYPDEVDVSVPEINLENAMNGMLISTEDNELIDSNLTDFDIYKSIDFTIENNNLEIYKKGKIILADNVLYQILLIREKEHFNEDDYNKFINSFSLK